MAVSVKTKNYGLLVAFLVTNLVLQYVVLFQTSVPLGDLGDFLKSSLGFGIVTVALIALDGAISSDFKARIALWRWENPLPGARAFSEIMVTDARIDVSVIHSRYAPVPTDPLEQNRLWYRIYVKHRDKVHILGGLGRFMLMRDCATLLVMMLPLGVLVALRLSVPSALLATSVGILIVQYIGCCIACRVYSRELILDVLAEDAAN